MFPIGKEPLDTGTTMHGWKHSANIDRLNIITVTGQTKLIVVNKGLTKKETCGWQNTNLTTLTRWHTNTGAKFTLTATDSSDMKDSQIT